MRVQDYKSRHNIHVLIYIYIFNQIYIESINAWLFLTPLSLSLSLFESLIAPMGF